MQQQRIGMQRRAAGAGTRGLVRTRAVLDVPLQLPRWTQIKKVWQFQPQNPDERSWEYAQKLVDLTAGSKCGLTMSYSDKQEVMEICRQLQKLGRKQVNTGPELSAAWRVLFTTEKETLFILKNAPMFGTTADGVYQVIDAESKWLQNVVLFPPEGAFVVNSDIRMAGSQRMAFNFNKAALYMSNDKRLPLPPFGSGWFETVFMGYDLRIARDSRGDTLVAVRDGEPEKYE